MKLLTRIKNKMFPPKPSREVAFAALALNVNASSFGKIQRRAGRLVNLYNALPDTAKQGALLKEIREHKEALLAAGVAPPTNAEEAQFLFDHLRS